ncbi:MAG TPA: GerMN domain-containing protein [Actinoplanes sp.]|nr:GerMN domain-containing protein [Actinoplanes sp.]
MPAQDEPHVVSLPRRPLNETASADASTEPVGEVAHVLCLVRDGRLVQAVRRADTMPTPQRQLDLLASGPNLFEQEQGLTSALATTSLTVTLPPTGTTATVGIAEGEEGTGRSDEVLAYGQIVCTLTSRADIAGVTFQRDGRSLQVPRGDGILSGDPLRLADYSSLTGPV